MLINITKINLNPNGGGGGKPIELENKEITITENGTTVVVPSDGFGGLSSVDITTDVPTPQIEANKSISITENGSYSVTPSDGYVGVGDVDISVFVSEVGTSIDFSEIGYNATDNQNANMIIQDGINYAKQIQTEYTDSKKYNQDINLVYFPMVDTSNRTSCKEMFEDCGGLQYVPPLTITNKCTDLFCMFYRCTSLSNIDVSNFDTSNITDMRGVFNYCSSMTELDLSSWNTSKVTQISGVSSDNQMFARMSNLKKLNVTNFDTSRCTTFRDLFYYCENLAEIIGIENWNTSNVTSLNDCFSNCSSLTSLDLSNWSTENVTSMGNCFYRCSSLSNLNISGWDFSNFTSLPSLWTSTNSFETLNITNCNFSTFTNFDGFLSGKNRLENLIGIETIDVSNATVLSRLFYNCSALTDLNLSTWNVQNATNFSYAFNNCTSLSNFQAPQNINAYISFMGCNNLTVDSLLSILNNLIDRTGTTSHTCELGTTNLNKLTDEQKAIATSKNWVLA